MAVVDPQVTDTNASFAENASFSLTGVFSNATDASQAAAKRALVAQGKEGEGLDLRL
ncbi:hypothetical protein KPG71_03555 [Roseovarius sp. PS-C2]|uniref:hypothetical protein n=1 Tax=Roseovarius sp. PS-C2 TaxID=2820814 RepID=UPI001C0DDB53|nr:hypothetical protein [Roseovarius sp. PS-C2]MBU3259083.1 hypothetical protein [Roseovarius sp. PS-C2]